MGKLHLVPVTHITEITKHLIQTYKQPFNHKQI